MDTHERRAQLGKVVANNLDTARFDLARVRQLLEGSPRPAVLAQAADIAEGVVQLLREMQGLQGKL